ncbi:hypothetical protein ABT354_33730 [Streptomyces sp. NPDC000594]|uniref:hypothetical protein n=1 Tax=Streptomyces sp. NPDC000594 TaxID=3154261 RepID=UPI00331C97A5
MSDGTNHFYGPTVNMHGGTGNTGMVNNHWGPAGGTAGSPALEEAVQELVALLRELRDRVPPLSAQSIDEAVPVLTAGPSVEPQERHRALMAIAGIATTAGTLGQPVADAVRLVLELLAV